MSKLGLIYGRVKIDGDFGIWDKTRFLEKDLMGKIGGGINYGELALIHKKFQIL